jgi:hypothetical protein
MSEERLARIWTHGRSEFSGDAIPYEGRPMGESEDCRVVPHAVYAMLYEGKIDQHDEKADKAMWYLELETEGI